MASEAERERPRKMPQNVFSEYGKSLPRAHWQWNVHIRLMISCLLLMDLLCFCHSYGGPDTEGMMIVTRLLKSSAEISYVLSLNCEALIEFLKALNDSNKSIIDWNTNLVSPCYSWSHVTCRNGNVISLSLASKGFSGTLSPSLTRLKFLVSLELQNNHLSGILPDYLNSMAHLQNLNLANNSFSGSIPPSWGEFSNLKHLIIRGNSLGGFIPDSITNMTGLTELDLSSNGFTGKIPEQLFSVRSINFTGTHLDCGTSLKQPCVSGSPRQGPVKKIKLEVVLDAAGGGVILISIVALFIYRHHLVQENHDIFVDVAGEEELKIFFGQLRKFSWREIQFATENFSESNVIGQGGFGKVYKGVLLDQTKVAIKRLTDYHNPGGQAAFQREVELISVAVHKNLLRLLGFCTTSSEKILVYPFMENLSVAYHLRDLKPGERGLDWPTRKHVAFGAAHGLEYLHDHCNPKIIHRDLKSANILLDDEFEAVLGDFGLAKLVDTKLTHVTTQIRGTMGHIAPEYLSTGRSSEKTDVFGYGITILELVTGQRAIDLSRLEEEEDVLLLDHIKKLLREKRLYDIVDSNLKQNYDPKEVEILVRVALLCTQSSPDDRPKMAEVVIMLQGEGLAERWAEWEQTEVIQRQEYSVMSHQLIWDENSTQDQEAIQLSEAR